MSKKIVDRYWQLTLSHTTDESPGEYEILFGKPLDELLLDPFRDFIDTLEKTQYTIDKQHCYRMEYMGVEYVVTVRLYDEWAVAQFRLMHGSSRHQLEEVIIYEEQHEGIVDGEVSAQDSGGLRLPGRAAKAAGRWLAGKWGDSTPTV